MTLQQTDIKCNTNGGKGKSAQPESAEAAPLNRQLVATMAGHELREPLNAIINFLNVMIQERLGPLNELQQEFLRSAETAARRLERRIDDIQVVFLEDEALKLKRTWINPNARVTSTCRELEWAAEKYEVPVLMGLEQSTRNPGVWADADRLDQILINLIENAIRYAPTGSEVRVTTAFRQYGYWTFVVENESEDEQLLNPEKWFEPGHRASRSDAPHWPGSGLGLTIAKHLVEAHGGEIWATVCDERVQVGFSIPHRSGSPQQDDPKDSRLE